MEKKDQLSEEWKERANRLGREWSALSPETDPAAKRAKLMEIYEMLRKKYDPQLRYPNNEDAFHNTFLELIESFDAEKGELAGFFATRYRWNCAGIIKKEIRQDQMKNQNGGEVPYKLSEPAEDEDNETKDLPSKPVYSMEEDDTIESAQLVIIAFLTNFVERRGKPGKHTKQEYYQLFYTTGMINLLKDEKTKVMPEFQHPRELERALSMPFVNFCMSGGAAERVWTLLAIFETELKFYDEVVPSPAPDTGQKRKRIPIPMPDKVGIAYMKVAASTYSEHRKDYNTDILQLLSSKDILSEP